MKVILRYTRELRGHSSAKALPWPSALSGHCVEGRLARLFGM